LIAFLINILPRFEKIKESLQIMKDEIENKKDMLVNEYNEEMDR